MVDAILLFLTGVVVGYAITRFDYRLRTKPASVNAPRQAPAPAPNAQNAPQPSFLEEKMWYEGEINFLFKFNERLISARSFQEVAHCIAEAAHNFLPVERTVLLMWDEASQTFSLACAIGWKPDPSLGVPAGTDSVSGVVIQNRETLVVADLSKEDYLRTLNREAYLEKTFISAPLVYKNEALGVLHVCGKKSPGAFSQREVSVVMSIVRMGAIALQNTLLYEQVSRRAAELETAYAELKDMQDKLVQAEKLKAIGQLASGVAHEMRNPIGIIMQGVGYLEQITPQESADALQTLGMIKDSALRADRIVLSLLDFSRVSKLELRSERIEAIIDTALSLVKTELKHIRVVRDVPRELPAVEVDRNKMMQIFINLFVNAAHAMPGGGTLTVRGFARLSGDAPAPEVVVEIEDTGVGISEQNLKKIFDPFFTTKGAGKGTGLGLSLCQNIILEHKGRIEVESQLNRGTKVIMTLTTRTEEGTHA